MKHPLTLPKSKDDGLRGLHTTSSEMLDMVQKLFSERKAQIKFNRKVISYDAKKDGTVWVVWEDMLTSQQYGQLFAGMHFRTGYLNRPKQVK